MTHSAKTLASIAIGAFGLAQTSSVALANAPVQNSSASTEAVGAQAKSAIASLQDALNADPTDPALMINLGIAFAQDGETEKARAMFKQAMVNSEPVDLETASGGWTDSKRLARKALAMLDRGEFRVARSSSSQQSLSQRD